MDIIEDSLVQFKKTYDYRVKINEVLPPQKFTAEDIYYYVTKNITPDKIVQIDDCNNKIVENLCLYFTSDNRFLTDVEYTFGDTTRSFDKGILLIGNVGVGKTYLMKAFINNPKQAFIVKSVKKIALEYKQKDNDLATLTNHSKVNFDKGVNRLTGKNDFSWCFDDLGIEENMTVYGNQTNVMLDILEMCYENKTTVHMTTNLSLEMIEERYGERLVDRLLQMFNILYFPEESTSRRI